MKSIVPVIFLILSYSVSNSQNVNVTWSEDFKMKKGSTDLSMLYADNTGMYIQEEHLIIKNHVFSLSSKKAASLVKMDKSFIEIYNKSYDKELDEKEFEDFIIFKNNLYLVSSEFNKEDNTVDLYVAKINKTNGDLSGEWEKVTTFQKDDKNDVMDIDVRCNTDSTKIIVVGSVSGKERNTYQINKFDEGLKGLSKPIIITNEFDPTTFILEDIVNTSVGTTVVIGREYE